MESRGYGDTMQRLMLLPARRSLFGDLIITAFLLAQALDGVFTYLGVTQLGPRVEANPLICLAMALVGQGLAIAGAKLVATTLGIALHVTGVHRLVALLTAVYVGAAVVPWATLLFAR